MNRSQREKKLYTDFDAINMNTENTPLVVNGNGARQAYDCEDIDASR